jgi:nucleoside-diphosphate-sugar epimerase
MSCENFLVTGAQGCIGSWVVKNLIAMGHGVVAYDIDDQPVRLELLLTREQLSQVHFVRGDVNDFGRINGLIEKESISHMIHLAGLMTPDCKANPVLGATVNVLGTLTLFEAAKVHRGQVKSVTYASSGAVLGPDERYPSHPIPDEAPPFPMAFYGAFKRTNEECARIYWEEEGIRSVGLRPPVVYGPGRDKGLTAGATLAIRAALLGQDYEIGFGGEANMEFVDDVAKSFIASALKAPEGAPSFNMLGQVLAVDEMIKDIEELFPFSKGKITHLAQRVNMANLVSDSGLQKLIGPFQPIPFRDGAGLTVDFFRKLLEERRLRGNSTGRSIRIVGDKGMRGGESG